MEHVMAKVLTIKKKKLMTPVRAQVHGRLRQGRLGCLSSVYARSPQEAQCCTLWDQDQHFSQALAGTAISFLA